MGVFTLQRGMCLLAALTLLSHATVEAGDEFSNAIQADWAAQEARHGRTPADTAAIRDAAGRFARLLDDLLQMPGAPDLRQETALLEKLNEKLNGEIKRRN
jgi:hypothetical protein